MRPMVRRALLLTHSACWKSGTIPRTCVTYVRWKAGYLRARGRHEIDSEHLPEWVRTTLRYDRRMDCETKFRLAAWALRTSGGHVGKAAERIGAHRNTVSALAAGLRGRGPVANNGRE